MFSHLYDLGKDKPTLVKCLLNAALRKFALGVGKCWQLIGLAGGKHRRSTQPGEAVGFAFSTEGEPKENKQIQIQRQ